MDSVPDLNQKVYVKEKINLRSGCNIKEVTNFVNIENKKMFAELASRLNPDILGFDFICQDISQPWTQQQCAIIEANSLPYIDMHHYPSEGQPQNVAKCIVEEILLN